MFQHVRRLVLLLIFCTPLLTQARLEFDATTNKIELYGPYIKYNVLKPPYSFGRYQFEINDIRMELSQNNEDIQIFIVWPRFLLGFGRARLISADKTVLVNESFREEVVLGDEKYARLHLDGEDESLLEALKEPFQICLDQKYESAYVKACSDKIVYKENQFQRTSLDKDVAKVIFNGKKSPKNAQISLDKKMPSLQLEIIFRSGFEILVRDKVRELELRNVAIDPVEKSLSVISGDGSVRPVKLTLKDKLFSFIEEKNYFRNKYNTETDWPLDLEDAEMEFAPYLSGASTQLFGLILPNVPPPFQFKLNENHAIATYKDRVELKGTKAESEVLAARVKNELFIHQNNKEFLWNFPAPKKAEINQNYISLQHKGKDHYFSKRIFRAHQSSISAAAALSTSTTLDIVPGFNFAAEHWFEEIWGTSSWSFQRWGISANLYNTDSQGFRPNDDTDERVSVLPINVELMFRLTPGVRPVQSSFGLGLRYLSFQLYRSQGEDIQNGFVGIGAFWHTAPQKIIDDIFNIVPFFRYPKWMEVSLYYYPFIIGPDQIGFSFSWQARGRLFFSKRWFLDASFNVNAISFERAKISGQTAGADSFTIGTAHGTIGLGAFF
jgi:hypothetical protein